MKQLHKPVYIFVLLLFYFVQLSCNNASDKPHLSLVSRPLDSYEINTDSSKENTYLENKFGIDESNKNINVAEKFSSLLVFHADDTMEVNKVYTAALALAKNAALDPLVKLVLESSRASDDNVIIETNIALGKRMKAELIDLSPRDQPSFRIDPIGSDDQNMNKTKQLIWQWNLEPLKAGDHKLMLSVEVGDEDGFNLPARNIPVTIFAKKVSFFSKVGDFFTNYWQWIITGILLPIFIAWLTNRIKRAHDAKK